MSNADPVVIVSFARTPMGGFQGALAGGQGDRTGRGGGQGGDRAR
jgi:acetyl-CoA C-acetyltransferase